MTTSFEALTRGRMPATGKTPRPGRGESSGAFRPRNKLEMGARLGLSRRAHGQKNARPVLEKYRRRHTPSRVAAPALVF
jgi:hypothetical protein